MWHAVIFPTSHLLLSYHLVKWLYVAYHGDNYCWSIHEYVHWCHRHPTPGQQNFTAPFWGKKVAEHSRNNFSRNIKGNVLAWEKAEFLNFFNVNQSYDQPHWKAGKNTIPNDLWVKISYLKKYLQLVFKNWLTGLMEWKMANFKLLKLENILCW